MANRIQYRRDTAANWTTINPVLALGEPGYETDTKRRKVGDGTTAWNSLAYQFDKTAGDATYQSTELRNLTPQLLPKWRRAIGKVRANVADARILCVGDSTTNGPRQGLGGYSYPDHLQRILSGYVPATGGLTVPVSAFASGTNTVVWDTASWVKEAGWGFGRGAAVRTADASGGTLVYKDPVLADRYDVYYVQASGTGSLAITATGGSTVTQDTNGTSAIGKVTVSAATAATTNTVSIVPTGYCRILGVEPWHSTTKRVLVGNSGVSSSKGYGDWNATGAWNSDAAIRKYAPDLTIISLGINDSNAAVTVDQYASAITGLVTAAQASGDVIIMPPVPSTSGATQAVLDLQAAYYARLIQVYGAGPFADLWKRWTSGLVADSLGIMLDPSHPRPEGYADIGQMLAKGLLSV